MSDAPDHEKPKKFWKQPLAIIAGLIGLIASTSTVVGLINGWFNPDTTVQKQEKKLDAIEQKLIESNENKHLVNQVSGRVSEMSDRFSKLDGLVRDIRLLDRALATQTKRAIVTPEQQKLAEASRKKELATLGEKLDQAMKMASELIETVERDDTLAKVEGENSKPAQDKARILGRAKQVREEILPELQTIQQRHAG